MFDNTMINCSVQKWILVVTDIFSIIKLLTTVDEG